MKIKRVNISSFGNLTGFFADFSEANMTLVYGDNEAGKTTLSEFLRTTLFPGKASKYPAPRKTDLGSVEVEMADGDVRFLEREQKKVHEKYGKPLPSDEVNMDADTYRALFAMDLDQLTNDRPITSGDFRKRFLTIPGGENVPAVSKDIVLQMDAYMSKERLSDTRIIGKQMKAVDSLSSEISMKEDVADSYNDLIAERERLCTELERAKVLKENAECEDRKEFLIQSMKENIWKRNELLARRSEISYAELLSDEDMEKYADYMNKIDALSSVIEEMENSEGGPSVEMSLERAREILSLADDITAALDTKAKVGYIESNITDLRKSYDEDTKVIDEGVSKLGMDMDSVRIVVRDQEARDVILNPREKKVISSKWKQTLCIRNRTIFAIFGAIVAILGVFFSIPALVIGGIVLAFVMLIIPSVVEMYFHTDDIDWEEWLKFHGFSHSMTHEEAKSAMALMEQMISCDDRRKLTEKRTETFVADRDILIAKAMNVVKGVGIDSDDYVDGLKQLQEFQYKAKATIATYTDTDSTYARRQFFMDQLVDLYRKYGSEERIIEMRRLRGEIKELDIRINELSLAIEVTSGMTTDDLDGTAEVSEQDGAERIDVDSLIDDYNQRIGRVTSEMNAIVDDDSLGRLRMELSSAEKDLKDSIRDWAVLSLANSIIAECSFRFYSDLQPSVIKTANRYLELMTEGRYKLASDPRDTELYVQDRKGKKNVTEWSSGLGDQVYLSIKMAIAKELGTERLPFILDDVLVRFDAHRRQGACRALMEFARDQQVIMFTCDNSLLSMFGFEGKINGIVLG